jgi:4-amino-4-deoxy-L-arabinose transferase-like glycosyltransferase
MTRDRMSADRRVAVAIIAIAAAGLALRVAYALLVAERVPGLGDAEELHGLANALGDGRGFVNPFAPPGADAPPTAHKPPLYPLLLAAVSAPGGTSWTAHQLASALMGSATVVVLALLATRAAGPRAGLVAAGLGAAYPAFVARDASLHSETLFALLVALALLAAWRARERPTTGRLAVLGAVIALAALTRSEGLLLLVLLALPALWRGRSGRARRAGVVAVACGLALAPWLVRCWVAFDRPVAITTSSGDLLAGANCDAVYGGALIGQWAFQCVLGERGANEAVVADHLQARGLRYAREHRGRLPAVTAARVLRPWGFFHPSQEVGLQRAGGGGPRWVGWLGLGVAWALLPAAVAGAVLLRRGREPLALLLAPVALVVVVSATAYGILRFRAAADVAIVVLAAVALDALAGRRMTSRVGAGAPARH